MHVGFDKNGNLKSSAYGKEAVAAQARITSEHIRSKTVAKLCLYALSAFFCVAASYLVVFAPDGREISTWIIAGALIVAAAGSAGFGALAITTPDFTATFGQGPNGSVAPMDERPRGPLPK